MQVLDMILDVLAYIWYGIKRIFKNPVLRDAAIVLLSVLVSVLVINARTKSINEQAEKRMKIVSDDYPPSEVYKKSEENIFTDLICHFDPDR